MDIRLFQGPTAFSIPFRPYLPKMGEKAAEEAGKQAGKAAWGEAKTPWSKLLGRHQWEGEQECHSYQ